MIVFIFAALLAVIVFMEIWSYSKAKRVIRVKYNTDLKLSEPGEIITLRYTVSNTSRLPMLFVGLSIVLDDGLEICESEEWKARYTQRSTAGVTVTHRLSLAPRSRYRGKLRFCLKKRGVWKPGRLYVETGDYLGMRSFVRSEDMDIMLICTARAADDAGELQTLGGLLGDITVRRFIHDDPTMRKGFHDYTGTEPMKLINWNQTAKASRLMVNEHDFTTDADVMVCLNMKMGMENEMERCLELTRTVCETLEDMKIPYALYSNGDIGNTLEGLGRGHIFDILRKMGISRLTAYNSFESVIERVALDRKQGRSYIVITPTEDDDDRWAFSMLERHSETPLYVIAAHTCEPEKRGEAS